MPSWFEGNDPWPTGSPAALALVEELSERFGPLEDAERITRVGIGVATGNDGVFLTNDPDLVESERLLPQHAREQIERGVVEPGLA